MNLIRSLRRLLLAAGVLALAGGLLLAADLPDSLIVNGREIKGIESVKLLTDGQVMIHYEGGLAKAAATALPPDFLKTWKISLEQVAASQKEFAAKQKQSEADQLERDIARGAFRRIDDVVFDTRRAESRWVTFRGAYLVQKIAEKAAVVSLVPDGVGGEIFCVENLPNFSVLADRDTITFTAYLTGSVKLLGKSGSGRTVRDYDCGQPCSRADIPAAVLSGKLAFAPLKSPAEGGTETPLPTKRSAYKHGDPKGNGTGFFITSDGYLITNYHVIEDARTACVRIKDKFYDARIIRSDPKIDLALLKVDGTFSWLPVEYTTDPSLGDAVFTIGFPNVTLQGVEPKYTDGKISSLAGIQDNPHHFQISVPVQPGNSGGPLVNQSGQVVGIVVARMSDEAALRSSGALPQNVNYAIKSKYLGEFLQKEPALLKKIHDQSLQKTSTPIKTAKDGIGMVVIY